MSSYSLVAVTFYNLSGSNLLDSLPRKWLLRPKVSPVQLACLQKPNTDKIFQEPEYLLTTFHLGDPTSINRIDFEVATQC